MESFSGKVAAITGAGSGIGRALALRLAAEGADLALADVDEESLAETARLCAKKGARVSTERVDVADRDAVFAWADQVVADHGKVNLIVNNAGVALVSSVEAMSLEDFDWLMQINVWGVVYGTKAFLPHIQAAGEGTVVNISSVFGLMAIPSQSAYNAAKFAVRGFTDALRMELDINGSPISALTVHPGGITTNIMRSARVDEVELAESGATRADANAQFDRVTKTTPDEAARQIMNGVKRNRRRILIGADAKVFDFVSRLPAGLTQRAMVAGVRRRQAKAGE